MTATATADDLRRQFRLPEADEIYLDGTGRTWETVVTGHPGTIEQWLIVHDYPLPYGYNVSTARAALLIIPGYPDTQIDMVFFSPALSRTDGQSIARLTPRVVDGSQWQQWSRHRTGDNPWRPGIDDIASHFLLVDYWLARELPKG
jgi:hypothetical protein